MRLSAFTMMVFSYNCKLLMVFMQAKTDSTEAYSATPNAAGRDASATDRFHDVRLPQAFRSLSSRELETERLILLINTDLFKSLCISKGIRLDCNIPAATLAGWRE